MDHKDILRASIILVVLVCVNSQIPGQPPLQGGGRLEYVSNIKRQWYYAYWDCSRKGGSLVDPNQNQQDIVNYVRFIENQVWPLNPRVQGVGAQMTRPLLPNERLWSSQECSSYYVSGSQLTQNTRDSCYWPRSWICRFN